MNKTAVILSTFAIAAFATGAIAQRRDLVANFAGGIGVVPVSSFAAPINQDGTFQNVLSARVHGESPAALGESAGKCEPEAARRSRDDPAHPVRRQRFAFSLICSLAIPRQATS